MSPRSRQLLLLVLALGCFGLAWAFAKTASEMLEGELLAIDTAVQHWVALHRSETLRAVFSVTTYLGAKEVLAPVAALAGWRLFRGTKLLLALLALTALAAGEFVALLKRDFHIMRPAGGVAEHLGYSFPSGHATGAAAVAVLFAYIAIRQRVHPRIIVSLCALIALLVGISRVYLDVHWASDVLGGWTVGAAFGAGCCAVYELLHRDQMKSGVVHSQSTHWHDATVAEPES
ncbi:MAG TPA: phosphatase PAP2 family protein [Gemmatimonadaceae bacterium]|nr:phosphatase PAP2 family protein [Gemmatimonadaceae bacterium]